MKGWAERLSTLGRVSTFDYPYMAAGRRMPGPATGLIESHLREARHARGRSRAPFVLAGKSMGSRVGCHVALEYEVDALVCFGYPLVSPSKKKSVRDEVLLGLSTPILFIQGTRDPLCPLPKLRGVIRRMGAEATLHVVRGGDHSLLVPKRGHPSQDEVDTEILEAVTGFLDAHA